MPEPPESWNQLFLGWLQDMSTNCPTGGNAFMSKAYDKAYSSLSVCPKQFSHPSELSELKFFGPSICTNLEKRLAKYCSARGIPLPANPREKVAIKKIRGNAKSDPNTSPAIVDSMPKPATHKSTNLSANILELSSDEDEPSRVGCSSTHSNPQSNFNGGQAKGRKRKYNVDIVNTSTSSRAVDTSDDLFVTTSSTTPNSRPDTNSVPDISNNPYVINSRTTPNFASAMYNRGSSNPRTATRKKATQSSSTVSETLVEEPPLEPNQAKRQKSAKASKSNPKPPRIYVPQYRSGGYAILLTLYHQSQDSRTDGGMTKREIFQAAAPLSDSAFVADSHVKKFYSAWNSMSTLINNSLVYKSNTRNAMYYATEEGINIAKGLLKAERQLTSSNLGQSNVNSTSNTCTNEADNEDPIVMLDDSGYAQEIIEINTTDAAKSNSNGISNGSANTFETPSRLAKSKTDAETLSSEMNPFESPKNELTPNSHVRAELWRFGKIQFTSSPNIPLPGGTPKATQPKNSSQVHEKSPLSVRNSQPPLFGTSSAVHNPVEEKYQRAIWPAGTFEVELVVDNREKRSMVDPTFFIEELKQLKVPCSMEVLAVGDLVWIARNKKSRQTAVLDFVVERKRLDDLVSSIKDGRYYEQKSRLHKTKLNNITYLIEESVSSDRITAFTGHVQTVMSETLGANGFFLKRTTSASDTVSYLAQMTKGIEERYSTLDLYVVSPKIITPRSYDSAIDQSREKIRIRNDKGWVRKSIDEDIGSCQKELAVDFESFQTALSKSGMATVKDVYIKMLLAIKGMTYSRAVLLQQSYPTPRLLIDAYAREQDQFAKRIMLSQRFGDLIKPLRFNQILSEKVYEVWGHSF